MSLIEALASGVPVIANNVGAISSLVRHDHNGYLSQNHSDWHEALESTIQKYQAWKEVATNEAHIVEERFSAKKWAEKTMALYLTELNS